MKMIEEESGEILVVRNPSRSCIEIHFKGGTSDEYGIVRLVRSEARRLAALILFQTDRLERNQELRLAGIHEVELKSA